MTTVTISKKFNFCDRLSCTHWSQRTSQFAQHMSILDLINMGIIFLGQILDSPCPVFSLEKQPATNIQEKKSTGNPTTRGVIDVVQFAPKDLILNFKSQRLL